MARLVLTAAPNIQWMAAALAALSSTAALALEAPLSADTHVSLAQPAVNFGAQATLNVGGGATGLLRFDLDTLPAGTTAAKLVKATLVLYVNRVGTGGAIDLNPVNAAWSEAGVTAGTLPPAGGVGVPGVPVPAAGQFLSLDVTSQVKSWIRNPATNHGWALTPALTAPATVAFFDSKENTATGHVARLDITLADQGAKGDTGPPGLPGVPGQAGPKGDKGDNGAPGAQGPQGIQGVQGVQGPNGVVTVGTWSGQSAVTVLSNAAYLFTGPTTTVTLTSGQRITASMSQTVLPSTTAAFRIDICFRPDNGTVLSSPAFGYKVISPVAANARTLLAVSNSFVPGPGTWVVGPCARQNAGANTLGRSSEDWSTGWAMVTN